MGFGADCTNTFKYTQMIQKHYCFLDTWQPPSSSRLMPERLSHALMNLNLRLFSRSQLSEKLVGKVCLTEKLFQQISGL